MEIDMWNWYTNLNPNSRRTLHFFFVGCIGGLLSLLFPIGDASVPGACLRVFAEQGCSLGPTNAWPALGNLAASMLASGVMGVGGVWLIFGSPSVQSIEWPRLYLTAFAAGVYKAPVFMGILQFFNKAIPNGG